VPFALETPFFSISIGAPLAADMLKSVLQSKSLLVSLLFSHYFMYAFITVIRDSSIDILTGYGLDGRGLIPQGTRFISTLPHPDRPTQPPIQWVPRRSFSWGKAAEA
jgi:hypothetical protein